jgi:hypothetical protein
MILKFSFLILSLFIFATCENENPSNSPLKKPLVLADSVYIQYQDTLFIEGENAWISFDSLLDDSRCPVGIICVWEGNAKIGFSLGKGTQKVEFSLNTYKSFLNDTTIWDYSISLLDVLPFPHRDSSYTPSDYSAKILVIKQ